MASGSAERSNQYKTANITQSSVTTTIETFPDSDAFYLMEFGVVGSKTITTTASSGQSIKYADLFAGNNISILEYKGYYKRQPYALHVQAISSFNCSYGTSKIFCICCVQPNIGASATIDSQRAIGARSGSSGSSNFRVYVTLIPPYLVDDDGKV